MNKFQQLCKAAKDGDVQLVVYNDDKGGPLFFRIGRHFGDGPNVEGVGLAKGHLEELQRHGANVTEIDSNGRRKEWGVPPARTVPAQNAAPARHSASVPAKQTFTLSRQAVNKLMAVAAQAVTPFIITSIREQKGKGK